MRPFSGCTGRYVFCIGVCRLLDLVVRLRPLNSFICEKKKYVQVFLFANTWGNFCFRLYRDAPNFAMHLRRPSARQNSMFISGSIFPTECYPQAAFIVFRQTGFARSAQHRVWIRQRSCHCGTPSWPWHRHHQKKEDPCNIPGTPFTTVKPRSHLLFRDFDGHLEDSPDDAFVTGRRRQAALVSVVPTHLLRENTEQRERIQSDPLS